MTRIAGETLPDALSVKLRGSPTPRQMSQTYVTIDSLKGIVLPILVADRGRPICDTFLPLHQTSMSSRSTSCLIKVIKMTRPTRVIRITMITTNDRPVSRIKVY